MTRGDRGADAAGGPAAEGSGFPDPPGPTELARRLGGYAGLRQRRYEVLPVFGPGAPSTGVQGREPGESTTLGGLSELVSSIARVGVLQPVLVEELPDGPRHLVAGERRLRAVRWGAVHLGDNAHFHGVPAVVCPGPLSVEERYVWQLVENLAREDLQPGELAGALMFERCAMLTARLEGEGVAVPAEAGGLEDPVERFRALDRLRVRAGLHHLGAPWHEVLRRLGIQLREAKARELVRAFAALPAELSSDMDAAKVALTTRLELVRLERGREHAAAELWAAVRAAGRPELLATAARFSLANGHTDPAAAVERAAAARQAADTARSVTQQPAPPDPDREVADRPVLDAPVVEGALAALRELAAGLRSGARLERYDAGSVALLCEELRGLLDAGRGAGTDPGRASAA